MRVGDDEALLRLPENLFQPRHPEAAALDHIREYVARADRGKLVGVADEDEIGLGLERVEQRGEQ